MKIAVFDLGGGTFDISILSLVVVYSKYFLLTVILTWAVMTSIR